MSKKGDEFFIGWQGKAPEGIGRFLRARTLVLLGVAIVLGGAVAALQGTIGRAYFEYGTVREFSGVLMKEPVPMLVADRADEKSGVSVYYLVNPWKFGFDPEAAEGFHLQKVMLRGTLVHREDGQAMIEVVAGSVSGQGHGGDEMPLGKPVSLGALTLRGEIVDSKCYLGVMNPGNLKGHRACAVNCIQGGIPPILLVRNAAGEANYFLLVDENGGAVNAAVLDLVALPVEITGEAMKVGDRLVMKAALEAFRLLE